VKKMILRLNHGRDREQDVIYHVTHCCF